jgi:hypothetical protein
VAKGRAAESQEVFEPVMAIQCRDNDLSPNAAGVYERAVAHVYADVGKRFAGGIEENEVTRLTGALIDWVKVICHLPGGTREARTVPGEYVLNKTAAIKAFGRGFLAPSVRRSL